MSDIIIGCITSTCDFMYKYPEQNAKRENYEQATFYIVKPKHNNKNTKVRMCLDLIKWIIYGGSKPIAPLSFAFLFETRDTDHIFRKCSFNTDD